MEKGKLVVIAERKFSEFFKKPDRFEASDVIYKDGFLYVVFDNLYQIAKIRLDLDPKKKGNELLGEKREEDSGYEGITFNPKSNRFYALVECAEYPDLSYRAKVHEYDSNFERRTDGWWLDFNFKENSNKGFEGLSWLERDGKEYLLALCEGNGCVGGIEGKTPGNGRIQVFEKVGGGWEYKTPIHIPSSIQFEDYSGLGLSGNRVFVTSQESSSLWIGTLKEQEWALEGEGTIYKFPTKDGHPLYCNIEGICEIPAQNVETRLVVVSDKLKKGKKEEHCGKKDESIHIFRVT
jgi:hypothetical protein